jgi:transcription-repair coupling factor (superfamily II helicase)
MSGRISIGFVISLRFCPTLIAFIAFRSRPFWYETGAVARSGSAAHELTRAELLPSDYVQSEGVRLEIYARAPRCRSDEELEDLENETHCRFDKLTPAATNFFAVAKAQGQLQ